MVSSQVEVQTSPFTAELYTVIDVLVAVGFDLAHRDGQVIASLANKARAVREREGLDLALCMLPSLPIV